jgi:hypothetical protein
MILLDYPFVSDFLAQTILEYNIPVIATPEAKSLSAGKEFNWISEKDAIQKLQTNENELIYTNSENSISWIQKNAKGTKLPAHIELFKNKIKFRELIRDQFPDYFFMGIPYEELKSLDISNLKFPFIIKPAVGFFSIAVYKVDALEEWEDTLVKIQREISRTLSLYPKEVIDNTDFILEEYIQGEEYAFDCYFDEKGVPVILNILHHIFTSEKDVSDRVYSTSPEIIERLYGPIMDFLRNIGDKVNLRNFPLHVEIRIDKAGKITPIEVNPMRFGGWCTTADLTWFAYGINSYASFFNNLKPEWNEIFQSRKDKIYSLILLDNPLGLQGDQVDYFDFDRLLQDFENPLHLRKIKFDKFGIFGFLFTETSKGNEQELENILHSDLKKYVRLKASSSHVE